MKKIINVAVDADGVIFDLFRYQIEEGLKSFNHIDKDIIINDLDINEIFKLEEYSDFKEYVKEYIDIYNQINNSNIDYNKYDIQDIFNCSKLRRNIFWLFRIYKYCMESQEITKAISTLKKWKSEGKKLYNITARVFVTENGPMGHMFRKILHDRYKKDGLEFDGIDLCSETNSAIDKYIACCKRMADYIIEDKIDNTEVIAKESYTKVLLFDSPFNEFMPATKNVTRIYSFEEADQIITDYENKLKTELNNKEYVNNGSFKRVRKENELSFNQLLDYYQQRKEYYSNVPYDQKEFERQEKNYKLFYRMIVPIFNVFNNTLIINKEKVPYQDGIIYISNHRGSLDQFALLKAIGNRPIHFLVHSKLLKLKRGVLYKNVGSIFIDKGNIKSEINALNEMMSISARNSNLFIFPEGTRNRDKTKYMLSFEKGPLIVAKATGAPIVPMAINDDYGFGSKGVIVRVADPIVIKPEDDIDEVKTRIEEIVGTMIWENMEEEAKRKLEYLKKVYPVVNFISSLKGQKIINEIERLERALRFESSYEETPIKTKVFKFERKIKKEIEPEEQYRKAR